MIATDPMTWFHVLWRASWQAAVLAGLVVAVQLAFGRRIAPRWRHAMWLLVLARLALPVVPSSPVSVFNLAPQRDAVATGVDATVDAAPVEVSADAAQTFVGTFTPTIPEAPSPPGPWPGWPHSVAAVWAAGVLLLGTRVAWATWRVARVVRRLEPVHDEGVLDLLRDTAAELRVRRLPALLTGDGLFSPALVGCLRPRLLLPRELLSRFDSSELRLVFLHELAHLKRRDVLVNWFASLLAVAHWPNPAVWLAAWRLRVERELATDELVLSHTTTDADRRAYGHTIVKLLEMFARAARPVPAGGVGILEGKQQMKRRITMIARFAKQSRAWTALAAVLVLALGVVALTDAVGAEPATPAPADKTAPPSARPAASDAAREGIADYRIGPKDLIELTVFDLEGPGLQTIKRVRVSETGKVSVPVLKDAVPVAGLSETEARRAIIDAYKQAHLLAEANVSVAVVEARNLKPTIGVGERITVSIMDLTGPGVETIKTARVDEDGNITLPQVGPVKAEGLRPAELEQRVVKAYNEANLLERATVAVSLADRGESHRLSAKQDAGGAVPAAEAAPAREPVDPAMEALLEREMPEVNFDSVALSDVIDFLRDVTASNIAVDWRGFEAAGIDRNVPVSMKLKSVPFKDVLKILLKDLSPEVRFDVEGNVIRISAPPADKPAAARAAKLERRTYNVADILGSAVERKSELVELLLQDVQPDAWRKNGAGGTASVTVFGEDLVVNASAEVHRDVEALLKHLRADAKRASTRPSFK